MELVIASGAIGSAGKFSLIEQLAVVGLKTNKLNTIKQSDVNFKIGKRMFINGRCIKL